MSVKIEMPKLSDTMTEGTLIKWHKAVGDTVEIGDVLAEVETDKATMEMEAFDEGKLTEITVQEGDKVEIGGVLAILDGDESENPSSDESSTTEPESDEAPSGPSPSAAAAAAAAKEQGETPEITEAEPGATSSPSSAGDRVKASPLAKKVASELGVNLSELSGSGPAGRIVEADVRKAADGTSSKESTSSSSLKNAAAGLSAAAKKRAFGAATTPAPVEAIQPVAKEGDERIELSSMRKVIASRLLTSKTTIPHFYLHVEVDAAPLMALRKQVNEQAEKTHGNKFSLNDFILKATINATEAVPAVNASFAGDHIIAFKNIGLSVAIAVEDGLVTPVIKEAETKSLLEISKAVKDFASRAKDKKLKPNEFDGGTITVSNLGAWGIDSFDAIVNPPQAVILSVGGAVQKPIVKDGQLAVGLRMNIGVSADHRVVDGAVAASFLGEVKKLIENPALMLL